MPIQPLRSSEEFKTKEAAKAPPKEADQTDEEKKLEELAEKVDTVAVEAVVPPQSKGGGKIKPNRCSFVDEGGKACRKKVPLHLRASICRCGLTFCASHHTSVLHNCKVLPKERKSPQKKQGNFTGGGSMAGNCV